MRQDNQNRIKYKINRKEIEAKCESTMEINPKQYMEKAFHARKHNES